MGQAKRHGTYEQRLSKAIESKRIRLEAEEKERLRRVMAIKARRKRWRKKPWTRPHTGGFPLVGSFDPKTRTDITF